MTLRLQLVRAHNEAQRTQRTDDAPAYGSFQHNDSCHRGWGQQTGLGPIGTKKKCAPIMMMPSVCGSFTNFSRQSTKLVPAIAWGGAFGFSAGWDALLLKQNNRRSLQALYKVGACI